MRDKREIKEEIANLKAEVRGLDKDDAYRNIVKGWIDLLKWVLGGPDV